jgi:hypothetical protein
MNVFVFRPQGISNDNVFTDWTALMAAMSSVEGRKMLEFDDSLVPPPVRRCEIPPGTWDMTDVTWAGFGPRPGVPRPRVDILSGARLLGLRMIGNVTVVGQVFAGQNGVPPISDFGDPDQMHIGLRDDGGGVHIANQGDVPIFDIDGMQVFFFIQNCLFGVGSLGVSSASPLIRFRGDDKTLVLNLLGLNQTGPNVVATEGSATVVFGALSSAAQVAFDQTSILNDNYAFGPQGRIQRQVIPRPPLPPATASQMFNKPNVLLRCDGTDDFTQYLPKISSGFTIGNSSVPLYSGGQEVVVAEVAGGPKLAVRPAQGDTIDGSPGEVKIGRRRSKTFISDGLDNWITIAQT